MSQITLKLVEFTDETDSLLFERRSAKRRRLSGHVTAVRKSPSNTFAPSQNRICSLQLLNISASGLGAMSADYVEIGSTISVLFPSRGLSEFNSASGQVVRCVKREHGYEIGVRLTPRAAV